MKPMLKHEILIFNACATPRSVEYPTLHDGGIQKSVPNLIMQKVQTTIRCSDPSLLIKTPSRLPLSLPYIQRPESIEWNSIIDVSACLQVVASRVRERRRPGMKLGNHNCNGCSPNSVMDSWQLQLLHLQCGANGLQPQRCACLA